MKAAKCLVIGLIFLTASASLIRAQEPPASQSLPDYTKTFPSDEMHRAPGKLLAQGKNRESVGALKVKTYLLEEVKLPAPLPIKVRGVKAQLENAYRLTVTGEDFLSGTYTIFIGEDWSSGSVYTYEDAKRLSIMIYGLGVLEDGATITLAKGWGCDTYNHTTLPEKLELPEPVKELNSIGDDPGNYVKSIRHLPSELAPRNTPMVEVVLATTVDFPVRNMNMVLQIGDREFPGDPLGPPVTPPGTLAFRIPEKEFMEAKDGGRIKVKYGACASGGVRFGRLNRSMLNK